VIFYSSLLELIGNGGKVIGIDIDIRQHNRNEIEKHPMNKNIVLIQDDSTSDDVIGYIRKYITEHNCEKILVALDSNHTHEHVLKELKVFSSFVSKGSYLVVFDTIVEDMPKGHYSDRPWDRGNNPKTAVRSFLEENDRFAIDEKINSKLLISACPDGYLKCIK